MSHRFFREDERLTKEEFTSRLTYPNPFSPSGLEIHLADDGLVTLQILNEEGRELATLLENKFLPRGSHQIEFYNARGEIRWENGNARNQKVYFYRLSVTINGQQQTDTKKIVLE